MNMISFIDELVKLGAGRVLVKDAATTSEAPEGMVGVDSVPDSDDVWPHDVRTRLPETARGVSQIAPGELGPVSLAKEPIDQERFNRSYEGGQ